MAEYTLNYTAAEIDEKLGEIDQLQQEKVDKNQGSSNVGKILVVGADGYLTLTDMPEGGVSGDVIGTLDENNNIIITGNLANGTYVFKYEGTDGTYADIGSLVVGGVVEYSITANLTNCTASNGNAEIITEGGTVSLTFVANDGFVLTDTVSVSGAEYTWDSATGTLVLSNPTGDVIVTITSTKSGVTNIIDTIGYTDGVRLNSSGSTTDATGYTTTGMIDISDYEDPVEVGIKGVDLAYSTSCYIVLYNAAGEKTAYNQMKSIIEDGSNWNSMVITEDVEGNQFTLRTTASNAANFFRITGYGSGANLIVTINEEIPV